MIVLMPLVAHVLMSLLMLALPHVTRREILFGVVLMLWSNRSFSDIAGKLGQKEPSQAAQAECHANQDPRRLES